ncbi:MAG: hypothetical protein KDE19_11360, partial [Caldilineaceae bacterium]|nr:hypothetical protein [Caldilineaceae bacterium]
MGKSDSKERRVELTANIWKGIEHPWLLGTVGALVLLLYLCALLVPQMPGQLRDDPAGAARWILVMSETYGPWGGVLRTLGLFTVLHNPLLQLLVILIALVLFVQLGSSIANLRRLYQLENGPARRAIPEQTDRAAEQTTAAVAVGEPLALPATQRLFRARLADNQSPAKLSAALSTYLADDFDEVWHTMRTVAAKFSTVEPPAPQPPQPDDVPVETDASAEQVREEQLWALRAGRQALLRPLLFIGMFLALVAVWFTLVWGWEVTPPPLAPGAEYRSTSRGLFLQYLLAQPQSPSAEGEQEDGEG